MSDSINIALKWTGGESFSGTSDGTAIALDGESPAHPSPMQALASGLAGCMAIDVVWILEKGRQEIQHLELSLEGLRADEPPRRFTAFKLHFIVQGDIEPSRVERAIRLSKKTYCSVWHTLRPDCEFETSFELVEAANA